MNVGVRACVCVCVYRDSPHDPGTHFCDVARRYECMYEVSPPPPLLNSFASVFIYLFWKMVHALQAWTQAKKKLKTKKDP